MAMVDGRRTCGKISGPRFCLFDFFSGLDPLFRHTTQHFSYPSHGLSLAILHFESVFFGSHYPEACGWTIAPRQRQKPAII